MNQAALALALELLVPPLSLLLLLWGGTSIVAIAVSFLLGLAWMPAAILGLAGIFIFLAIALAWRKFARQIIPLRSLLTIPFYLAWKIPLYCKFLIKPQSRWLKTEREQTKVN